LPGILFYPEDGGNTFRRKSGKFLQDYMLLYLFVEVALSLDAMSVKANALETIGLNSAKL
jgi:hypothetical protein